MRTLLRTSVHQVPPDRANPLRVVTNEAVGVTSASSTPSCSTIICFTRSSTLAIPIPPRSLIALSVDFCLLFPRLTCLHYARGVQPRQIVRLAPLGNLPILFYPAPKVNFPTSGDHPARVPECNDGSCQPARHHSCLVPVHGRVHLYEFIHF